ncbi:nicotinate (nicotinamide) nucleotide adenylyltransferase [Hydrogenimonas urashimensis]|uniref:nicotinate (nicotinamide) nucleotide adenylyltransferase n=1 Tax=Hydrogenimonas urashimensis TaxID=2740515 RepID=UPI001914FE1A|nr:nicotinate (nicotinamide) nucleotide adenylyltransferase [Hydrogenimonas urashimensis]
MKREKKKSVAIFGGSFDPPHLGHLEIMKKALEKLDIDKLIVVPAFISPFKKGHRAPPKLRLKWLGKIAAFDPRIEISDFEIKKEGPSYSIDTVNHFARFFDTIYFIIGADNLKDLHKWHRFDELNEKVRWVVATRNDEPIPEGFIRLDIDMPISSTALREKIDPAWIPEAIREEVTEFYKQKVKN